jgi:hypothetical protein
MSAGAYQRTIQTRSRTMKAVFLLSLVLALQQPVRPQAFVDRTTGKAVAIYDQDRLLVTKDAPPTLRICLTLEVCKTRAEWLAK